MTTQTITTRLTDKEVRKIINVVQGDSGRSIIVEIKDMSLASSMTATVTCKTAANNIYGPITAQIMDGTKIKFTIPGDWTSTFGDAILTVTISKDGQQVSTFAIGMIVNESAGYNGTPMIESGEIYVYIDGEAVQLAKKSEVDAIERIPAHTSADNGSVLIITNNSLAWADDALGVEELRRENAKNSEIISSITVEDSLVKLTQLEEYEFVTDKSNLVITPTSETSFAISGTTSGTFYIGLGGGITSAQVSEAHTIDAYTGNFYFEAEGTSGITLRAGDIAGGSTYSAITNKSTVNLQNKYLVIRVIAGTYTNAQFSFAVGQDGKIPVKSKLQNQVEKNTEIVSSYKMTKLLHPTYTQFIAHKGSETRYPANSKIAYEMAGKEGWDVLNIAKIRQSADGTWWVMHDESVDATTDGSGAIANLTDAYLRTLKTTTQPSYAQYNISDFTDEELKLITFEDALKIANRYGMRVMVRGNFPSNYTAGQGKEIWDSIIDILRKYGRYTSDTIISGIRQQCHVLRDLIKVPCEINFYAQGMTATAAVEAATAGTIKDLSNLSIMIDNEYLELESTQIIHDAGFKIIATSTEDRPDAEVVEICESGADYLQDRTRFYI